MTAVRTAETITSLDVFLNSAKVGTIVRTPGDFNAFSLDPAYRATGGIPVLSLSLRAASGGLRKDPRPVAGSLLPFFANLLPEDRLREAMERREALDVVAARRVGRVPIRRRGALAEVRERVFGRGLQQRERRALDAAVAAHM